MQTCFPERKAFTLVELIVSTAIIGLIMIVLVSLTNETSKTWRSTTEKVEKFQEARDGFEAMTRRLAQATLNTNWDYLNAAGQPRPTAVGTSGFNSFVPVMYGRTANLRFLSGPMSDMGTVSANPITYGSGAQTYWPTHGVFFQAPLGMATTPGYDIMNNLLNTWGYFIQAGYDTSVPGFVTQMQQSNGQGPNGLVLKRWRSRLMEFRQPTEQMSLYDPAADTIPRWFTTSLTSSNPAPPVHSLAENIIALVIRPRLSPADENYYKNPQPTGIGPLPWQLCPYYIYDSTQTLNPQPTPSSTQTAQINPKNQLPPIVNVTMVALDERSAKRLDERWGTGPNGTNIGPPDAGLGKASANAPQGVPAFNTLFTNQSSSGGTQLEGPLGAPSTLAQGDQSDLNNLEQILIHAMDIPGSQQAPEPLTYRIFTTNVTIRGAKWSRFQTH